MTMKPSQCASSDIIFSSWKSLFLKKFFLERLHYAIPLSTLKDLNSKWLLPPCLCLSWFILWIGIFLHWFLPNLCRSNETSFWFQRNMPELRHPNESSLCQLMPAWKLCIYSNDATIILNVLELVCENCPHSLNNLEFTKHLFSIFHAYYT